MVYSLKISYKALCFLNIYIKYDARRSEITYVLLSNRRDRVVSTKSRGQMTCTEVPLEEISILSSVHFHDGIM